MASAIRVPSSAFPVSIPTPLRVAPRIATLDCPERLHELRQAAGFAFATCAFMLCVLLAAITMEAAVAGGLALLAALVAAAAWSWNFACAALVADRWVFDGEAGVVWREERPFGVVREKVGTLDDVRRVVLHGIFEGDEGARYVWTPLVQLDDGRMLRSGSTWPGTWDGPHAAPEPPAHLVELGREIAHVTRKPLEIVLGRALAAP